MTEPFNKDVIRIRGQDVWATECRGTIQLEQWQNEMISELRKNRNTKLYVTSYGVYVLKDLCTECIGLDEIRTYLELRRKVMKGE